MPKILAVHGIGQQFKGDAIIHDEWWPPLLSGLHLAGGSLQDPADLVCPFYGHLFRNPGAMGAAEKYDIKDVGTEEEALLLAFWDAAAIAEPEQVPSRMAFGNNESLARTPGWVQRALNALSKSKFFGKIAQRFMIGDLKQVTKYLHDQAIHAAISQIVLDQLTDDVLVVIGHSLGSVVAYEALCRKPANVRSFISIGSPLGIRNAIFDHLTPSPTPSGTGIWPGVQHWTNISDAGDVVAMQKKLAPRFGDKVKDIIVYNGADPHHGEWYLSSIETGKAILQGL